MQPSTTHQSDPASTPTATPTPGQPTKHGHGGVITVITLIVALAAAAGGYWYGLKSVAVAPAASPSPTVAANATEVVAQPISLNTVGAAATISAVKLSAPISWRTTRGPATACDPSIGAVSLCTGFNFANALGTPATLEQTNNLVINDLTSWLTVATPDVAGVVSPFAGLTSVAAKSTAVANTLAINATTAISVTDIKPSATGKSTFLDPVFTGGAIVGPSKIDPLVTADGSLHGYTFIATQAQAADYSPRVYVVLVGKSGNSTVSISGSFQVNDAQSLAFQAAIKANPTTEPALLKNYVPAQTYTYPADAVAQYAQVVAAMKTLSLSK
ncbi:hypothetical protein HJC99_04275 [Candidatus Saccharibacteria bacterium]|nr:hypothetical protein [Candidatus Saccharibacteria bacterium]